ncbi:hypothetical protein F5Y09DRAFT_355032 [Xylaria sp. FL1042]|nr:hypothetical protein F5Y09DRAFT_355032 [Xylaria sp. FL1042]
MEQNYFELLVRDQNGPHSPPSRSMSFASTADSYPNPYTPTSDPSTPLTMDHDHMECGKVEMGITPPGSDFGGSFSSESSQYLDFGFNAYPHQLVSPPLEYVTPQYPANAFNQYDAMQAWAWPQEAAPIFLEANTSGVATTPGQPSHPQTYFSIQERTAALHEVQNGSKTSRRGKAPVVTVERRTATKSGVIKAVLCQSGKHICTFDGCNKAFKRAEHLKRHFKCQHSDTPLNYCPFCPGTFNRLDNYRGHIKLHKNTDGRVKYHPDARAFYDKLNSQITPRKTRKTAVRAKARLERRK